MAGDSTQGALALVMDALVLIERVETVMREAAADIEQREVQVLAGCDYIRRHGQLPQRTQRDLAFVEGEIPMAPDGGAQQSA